MKALVISGGGSKGAYAGGVASIKYLLMLIRLIYLASIRLWFVKKEIESLYLLIF